MRKHPHLWLGRRIPIFIPKISLVLDDNNQGILSQQKTEVHEKQVRYMIFVLAIKCMGRQCKYLPLFQTHSHFGYFIFCLLILQWLLLQQRLAHQTSSYKVHYVTCLVNQPSFYHYIEHIKSGASMYMSAMYKPGLSPIMLQKGFA